MITDQILRFLQIAVSSCTLVALIVAAVKVVRIAEKGVESHEGRISNVEEQVAKLSLNMLQLAHVGVKLDDMKAEIERMRNRLDRFLDSQKAGT